MKKKFDSWWLLLGVYVYVIPVWVVYRLDTNSFILFFVSLGILIFLGKSIMAFQMKPSDWKAGPQNVFSKLRYILPMIAALAFIVYVSLTRTHGGSPMSEGFARNVVEGYVDGTYYLTNHGNYTAVPYDIWELLSTFELLMNALFVIAVVWNIAYSLKTKAVRKMQHVESPQTQPPTERSEH